MRSNLNGAHSPFCLWTHSSHSTFFSVLVNNLRVHIKPMYQLYCVLKDRNDPLTSDEIDIASGKMQLDGRAEVEYLKKLENASENIKKAFEDQRAREAVSDNLILTCISHSRIIEINREHGTRRSLSNILLNGLLRVINLSTRLKNPSLSR